MAELIMIYGRYNELVNGVYFMVYEPTFTSVGGGHPVWYITIFGIWKTISTFIDDVPFFPIRIYPTYQTGGGILIMLEKK